MIRSAQLRRELPISGRRPLPRRRRAGAGRSVGAGLATLLLALCPALSSAHDFYLVPSAFDAPTGTPIALEIGVGHAFEGDPMPFLSDRVESFEAWSATGAGSKIYTIEGANPGGVARLSDGEWTITYRGKPWIQELSPDGFRAHLEEVGHSDLLSGVQNGGNVQERVVRCASSVVRLGDASKTVSFAKTQHSCDFELRPVRREDDIWTIALLRRGEPLANTAVNVTSVGSSSHGHSHGKKRMTSADGTVQITTRPGRRYLVTAVQVEPLTGDPEAQYRSDWASLSVGPADDRPVRPHS